MTSPYETLVRWYLRFNGFLCAENFVLHEPNKGRIPAGGEFDILAVRFPFSNEAVNNKAFLRDNRLSDAKAPRSRPVDFVIAEVKEGRPTLNEIWKPSTDEAESTRKVSRVAYMLRWLGPIKNDDEVETVARELQGNLRAQSSDCVFRVVVFGNARDEELEKRVPVITFGDIADFLASYRTQCWQEFGLGFRSDHSQWDSLIRQAWDAVDSQRERSKNAKAFLDVFKKAAKAGTY